MLGLEQARYIIELALKFGCSGHAVTLSRYGMDFNLRDLRQLIATRGFPLTITGKDVDDWAEGKAGQVFFRLLGFDRLTQLEYFDLSPATYCLDLNADATPPDLVGTADAVFDLGTSEHVFHLPNVLKHVTAFAKPGALVFHHTPANNHANHGFYQFAPTLYRHYYTANRFEILAQYLNGFNAITDPRQFLLKLDENRSREQFFLTDDKKSMNLFVARKTAQSLSGVIPQQDVYVRLLEE